MIRGGIENDCEVIVASTPDEQVGCAWDVLVKARRLVGSEIKRGELMGMEAEAVTYNTRGSFEVIGESEAYFYQGRDIYHLKNLGENGIVVRSLNGDKEPLVGEQRQKVLARIGSVVEARGSFGSYGDGGKRHKVLGEWTPIIVKED